MLATAFIIISVATAVALVINSFFSYLKNRSVIALLQKHLDKGHELNVEVVQLLHKKSEGNVSDLRKAVLLTLLGATGIIYSFALTNGEFSQLLHGGGVFAFVCGIGYFISIYLERKTRRDEM